VVLHTLLFFAAGVGPAAPAKGDVAAEVERAVYAVQTAFNKGDVDAVRKLLTDDHVALLTYAHFSNTADQLKVLSDFKFSEYKIDGLKVKPLTGDVAQVTYRATIKGTYAGKVVPSPVHVGEVWVKRDGKWLQASYQETPAAGNSSEGRTVHVERGGANVENEWLEKLAIQELCARYCATIDAQDCAGWADCFTAEGVFESDGWAIRGRAALREYAEAHARHVRCRHMTVNHLYEVRGDAATGTSTTVVTLATPGGYKILGQGAYEDRLVKEGGKWRIASRRVRTDRLVADPDRAINQADPDVAALVGHLVAAARRLGKPVR
jgi:ketosteroid isomerase-like protein